MKKEIIISALALFLIVSPAFAKQESSKENSSKNNQNHKKDSETSVQALTDSITPTAIPSLDPSVSPSPTIINTHKPKKEKDEEENEDVREEQRHASPSASPSCSPERDYKNHGEYVSCVAREHRGGKEVSEAARSEIGKKHEENDENDENEEEENDEHPSPTITSVITPTATISPITSSLPSIQGGFNPFKSIEENLHRFFDFLLHFI